MLTAVTGASGHLGINLIQTLLTRGYQVRAVIHKNIRGLDTLPVGKVSADVLDKSSLHQAFKGVDIVFHLAARVSIINSDAKKVEDINVSGVQNVIDTCFSNKVKRLVHLSSIHAYRQKPLNQTLDETRPLIDYNGKETPYDRSKAEGERRVMKAIEAGLDAIILNPTGIIGRNDYEPSHFGASLLAIAKGQLPVNIDAGFNWVDVRDVAGGIVTASEKAKAGARYLLSGHWVNMPTIARIAANFTGRKPIPLILPMWVAKMSAPLATGFYHLSGQRPLFTVNAIKALESNRQISYAKANRDLGYDPRPFEETVYDTLQWFQTNGYLQIKR